MHCVNKTKDFNFPNKEIRTGSIDRKLFMALGLTYYINKTLEGPDVIGF